MKVDVDYISKLAGAFNADSSVIAELCQQYDVDGEVIYASGIKLFEIIVGEKYDFSKEDHDNVKAIATQLLFWYIAGRRSQEEDSLELT